MTALAVADEKTTQVARIEPRPGAELLLDALEDQTHLYDRLAADAASAEADYKLAYNHYFPGKITF